MLGFRPSKAAAPVLPSVLSPPDALSGSQQVLAAFQATPFLFSSIDRSVYFLRTSGLGHRRRDVEAHGATERSEDHRPFHDVLQLADVPWPVV